MSSSAFVGSGKTGINIPIITQLRCTKANILLSYTSFKAIFKAVQKLHVGKPLGICFYSSNSYNQRNNTDPAAVSGSFTAHCFQKFFQLPEKFLLSQQAHTVQTAFPG